MTLDVTSWVRTRILTRSQYYDNGKPKSLSFAAGSTVDMLMPRAESNCIFSYEGEIFETSCFDFPGVSSTTTKDEWWLQVECGTESGWMSVDSTKFEQDREF